MAKDKKQAPEQPVQTPNPQIPIQLGNIEVLTVKLLSDINNHLRRIADALEKKV